MAAKTKDFAARVNPRNGRYRLISGNWKMNHNHLEAINTVQKLFYSLRENDYHFAEISIHPPFTDLRSLQLLFDTDRIPMSLGAQNCYFESSGAFTGEISPQMLARLAVKFVIVGHSERRDLFGESNQMVSAKVKAVFDSSMVPIVCVGESLPEREANQTTQVLGEMVDSAISSCSEAQAAKLIFAYEPKWAIGSGRPAEVSDAEVAAQLIRSRVELKFGDEVANSCRVQYGGSVSSANAKSYLECPEIDGLLVGGASLDADSFVRVIQA